MINRGIEIRELNSSDRETYAKKAGPDRFPPFATRRYANMKKRNLSGSGNYNLTAYLPANIATPAYISATLYNNGLYYISQPVVYR